MRGATFLAVALVAGLLSGCAKDKPDYDAGYQAGSKWSSNQAPSQGDVDEAYARTPTWGDSDWHEDSFKEGFWAGYAKQHPPLYAPPIGGAGGA
jgi:hypothetical protein